MKRDRSQVVLGYVLLTAFIAYMAHSPMGHLVHLVTDNLATIAIGLVVVPAGVLLFLFAILSPNRQHGKR